MNAMQVFNYEGNKVRTVMKDGEPWWVLADVCRVLGLVNPSKVATRLDPDEKMTLTLGEGHSGQRGGAQQMRVVNESGLYKVILRSDKPEAKKFTRWVTHEVLPTLRKTGTYSMPGAAQPFTMEQMAQFAAAVAAQVVTQIVPVIISTVKEAAQTAQPAVPAATAPEVIPFFASDGPAKCKLETFPPDIVRKVEEMLTAMEEQQNLNFSMIARFCTINGYTISSPAVKTYYQRHFAAA